MAEEWQWLTDDLAQLQREGLLRVRKNVVSLPDGWCEIDNQRLRNFSSNDYLNLAHDPRLAEAAQLAIQEYGVGAAASALVTGRSPCHQILEERLADFEGAESAVLFPSGYAANVGTIAALADERDVVFCERLNHASLIDGCRLSGAKFLVYRYQQLDKLQSALRKTTGFRNRWIITDSLFSMDGNAAPLEALADIADRHDAKLIIDEAHATGILGEHGRGVAEWQGVEDRVAVRVGTLSKALGTMGGFVAGPKPLTDWLWNNARTQMFSTALPPAICAAASCAVNLVDEVLDRRQYLHALACLLRNGIADLGLEMPPDGVGPIVPVIFRDAKDTLRVANDLMEAGFLAGAIRPPTVPRGTSRIRITLTAAHTEADVNSLIACLAHSRGSTKSQWSVTQKEQTHE